MNLRKLKKPMQRFREDFLKRIRRAKDRHDNIIVRGAETTWKG